MIAALAAAEARSHLEQDHLYRRWVASHGGVYVPPTEASPPNPYLDHVPNRDVVTRDGQALTLINPAYMTRQVYAMGVGLDGLHSHLTSLRPLRPENAADSWEVKALTAFERGTAEVMEEVESNGTRAVRLMRPMMVEQSCLKCHASQGYHVGQVRGGLSVTVPLARYSNFAGGHARELWLAHVSVWAVGWLALWLAARRIRSVEAGLRRSQDSLNEAQALAQIASWEYDLASKTTKWSAQMYRLLEMPEPHTEPVPDVMRKAVHPDDWEPVRAAYLRSLQTRGTQAVVGRLVMPDGRVKFVQAHFHTECGPDGKPACSVGTMQDITERHTAELELEKHRSHLEELVNERTAQLSEAKQAAEVANRAKSAFLANMSHELRTPLNAIVGMAELAQREATDPKQSHQLSNVVHASRHLIQIINDILDLSKIEAERLELDPVDFLLADVIANVVGLVRRSAMDKSLRLRVIQQPGLARRPLRGDRLRLQQILLNLLGNAIKFTHAGSVSVRVTVQSEDGRSIRLRFEVQDTGIGIAPADIKRLFNAFAQADGSSTRVYGGTGLGLAISKRLVGLMGGEIGAESEPGKGSTFWFTVQVEPGRTSAGTLEFQAAQASNRDAEQQVSALHAGKRVLLVEDDSMNQELATELLQAVRLQVDVAGDGDEAMAMARQTRYDAILMDVQMPRCDGLAATRAIRAESLNRDTPILALTAGAFDEDREQCLAAGMTDHVAKPIDPAQLYAALLCWLDSGAAIASGDAGL